MHLLKSLRALAPLAGGLLLCVSCSKEPEAAALPSDALAVVGSRIITHADLMVEAQQRHDAGLTALTQDALLERMITQVALVEKARQQGLDQEPDVQREIERVLATQLRERELSALLANLSVSEEALRGMYAENRAAYTTPALHRIAWLYLKKDKNASAEKQAELRVRMQDVLQAAGNLDLRTSGFGEWAVSHSDDMTSRYRGGDLGWIRADQPPAHIPEPVWQLTRSLPLGKLSELIETDQGLYLTVRTDERSAVVKPFEAVRASLEKQGLKDARAAAEKTYYESCHAAVHVQMIEENVARLTTNVDPSATASLLKSPANQFLKR